MTEVVLERTFDIKQAQKIIDEDNLNVSLTDSGYAYHINSKGIDKGSGFLEAIKMLEVDVNDTIAIGDSEVDELMMQQSDIAIMAHNHKHNRDLLPGLMGDINVRQWSQTGESNPISNFESISVEQIIQLVEVFSND